MSFCYVKLDTAVIAGFDEALAGQVIVLRTGLGASLMGLAKLCGFYGSLRFLWAALLSGYKQCLPLVEGNVKRKVIRLPGLFRSRAAKDIYGRVKAIQAALLRDYLQLKFSAKDGCIAIVYNGSNYPESVLADVFGTLGKPRLFVEAGFFPGTLQIDPIGLNAANTVPRDPHFYLNAKENFAAGGLPKLVNNRPSKFKFLPIDLPSEFIFVPFQVPSDMQVTLHSPWVKDMEEFLDLVLAAAARHPEETFVIKEHPSFKLSVRDLRCAHPRVIFANGNVTSELIAQSRAVITLNSTVGLEALLLEKSVILLGEACYDLPGLVLRARTNQELDAAISSLKSWTPDPILRRQYLGYLWNHYLVRASYDNLPPNLGSVLEERIIKTTM